MHSSLGAKSGGRSVGVLVKWKPPDVGTWILNTDGAFKASNGCASDGGLIRNSAGDWV